MSGVQSQYARDGFVLPQEKKTTRERNRYVLKKKNVAYGKKQGREHDKAALKGVLLPGKLSPLRGEKSARRRKINAARLNGRKGEAAS